MDASSGVNTSNGKPLKCNQNVQVYLRVRPTNAREKLIRSQEVVEVVSTREVLLKPAFTDTRNAKKFTFDRAFDINSKQYEVYQSVVAPYIQEVLAGFNCTVFAYGQTGTGKTYTMIGEEQPELSSGWDDDSPTGIIPRALNHLFDDLRMTELEFSMRVSYLELYNEELFDLLSTDDTVKIRIFDDVNKKGSVIVQGLEEILVHSKDDVYKLLAKGQERRRTASTLMNAQSSRSHTIFSIIVHIKENGIDGEELLKIGKLNLVDLAGSENITKAGNEKGIRTRESVNINQSLLTLGRVITALVERTPHIPYRESKLTRLLQESLGGRTKTSIIATVSPGHKDFEETMSTLEYAHRAKNIQNKPEANQKLSKKTVIKEYTEEIDRLKRELHATRDKNGIYLPEETYNEMIYKSEATTKELNDKVILIKILKEDLAKKEAIFKEVSLNLVEKEEVLRKTENDLCVTKHELISTKRNLGKTKRRYAEKKVVLDRHIKTEEALSGQAKELIEVVETVQGDATELHNTIDRRRQTDAKNQSVCEQFVDKMKNRLQVMHEGVTTLSQNCFQITNAIDSDWENYLVKQKSLREDCRSKIATLESLTQDTLLSESSMLEAFKGAHLKMTSEQLEAAQEFARTIERTTESVRTILSANVQALKKTISDQDAEHRDLLSRTFQICRENNLRSLEFCAGHSESLKQMDQMIEQFGESQHRITKFVESSRADNDKRKRQLKELQEKIAQISEELNGQDACIEDFASVFQEVENKKLSVRDLIQRSAQTIEKHVEVQNGATKTLDESCAQLEAMRQEHKSVVEGRLQNKILSPVEGISKQLDDTADQQMQLLKKLDLTNIADWDNFVGQRREHRDEFSSVHELQSKSIQDHLESKRTAECEFRNNAFALNRQFQRNISTYQNQTNANISELTEQTERFLQEDLTLYQPTGQTPVRKTISYPKDLAMTSPHDRIIRRFWRERAIGDLDLSNTISEDNEDVSLLYDSPNSDGIRNSTPLHTRKNNLEEDKKRFKDLQISNILSKIGADIENDDNKENIETGHDTV